jgi:O-antigen ligase
MLTRALDRAIYVSLCLLVFVLPATIAGVSIFSGLAILFLIIKRGTAFRRPGSSPGLPGSVALPLTIFVLVCFISIFISMRPDLSMRAYVGKVLKVAALLIAVYEVMSTARRRQWFLRCFLFSALILCLDAFWQMLTGFDVFRSVPIVSGRVSAAFNHPNDLGAYLNMAIPVSFYVLYDWVKRSGHKGGSWWLRLFLALAAGALLVGTLGLTFSRGAWLGFAASLVVFLILMPRSWPMLLGVAVIFGVVFYPQLIHTRQVSLLTERVAQAVPGGGAVVFSLPDIKEISGDGRIRFWKDALRIILDHPVLGTGLNTYTVAIKNYVVYYQCYPHNCYLQMAAELGFAGLAAFLWFLAAVFHAGKKMLPRLRKDHDRTALAAVLAALAGILVESALDTTFYSVQLSVLLWLIIGMAAAFLKVEAQEGRR